MRGRGCVGSGPGRRVRWGRGLPASVVGARPAREPGRRCWRRGRSCSGRRRRARRGGPARYPASDRAGGGEAGVSAGGDDDVGHAGLAERGVCARGRSAKVEESDRVAGGPLGGRACGGDGEEQGLVPQRVDEDAGGWEGCSDERGIEVARGYGGELHGSRPREQLDSRGWVAMAERGEDLLEPGPSPSLLPTRSSPLGGVQGAHHPAGVRRRARSAATRRRSEYRSCRTSIPASIAPGPITAGDCCAGGSDLGLRPPRCCAGGSRQP